MSTRIDDEGLPPSHPDGRPWRKACPECAFRRHNPQGLQEEDFDHLWLDREMGGYVFFCAHRVVDGCVRECACWAAMEAGRAVDAGMTA